MRGPIVSMTWPQYRRGECSIDGRVIHLQPKLLELLSILLMRRGHVVTYGEMIEALWPDPFTSPDWERSNVTVHLCRLRKLLPDLFETAYGLGVIMLRPEDPGEPIEFQHRRAAA